MQITRINYMKPNYKNKSAVYIVIILLFIISSLKSLSVIKINPKTPKTHKSDNIFNTCIILLLKGQSITFMHKEMKYIAIITLTWKTIFSIINTKEKAMNNFNK